MKKYSDFILALVVLIAAILFAVIVLVTSFKRNGGSLFPVEKAQTTETNATKSGKNAYTADDETVGTIFIGDSRFVGMDKAVDIESHEREFCVAKVGQGYYWFKNTALKQIEKIRKENTALTKWRYVVCLGVNDLGNSKNYIEEYEELTGKDDSIQLVLVSVNPVKNYPSITNSQIKKFNIKLSDAGYDYIDTFSVLQKKGFNSTDGLHYDDETYKTIYDLIEKGLLDLE